MTILTERDAPGPEQRKGCRPSRLSTEEGVALLVHDLRSPVAAIENALRAVQLAHISDPVLEKAVGVMNRQVTQLGRLIGDLLDLTRVRTGKLELLQEWLDLRTAVADAVETCRPVIERYGHQLTVSLPQVRLRADPARLQQMLVNLLTNAAKYTEPGGHIQVTAESVGAGLVLRIWDDGIGICPTLLPRIFDLFQQGPDNRGREGLGIGLALVQWLVELHGGSIEAFSDGPGKGSEFVLRMPVPEDLVEKPRLCLAPPRWPCSTAYPV